MHRTRVDALAAAYAFAAVRGQVRIDIHLTCFGADAAVYAFLCVYAHADQAHPLEEPVKGSQRADVFAERPVDEDRCRDAQDQQQELPPEEPAERPSHHAVEEHQGYPALKRSDRTYILAEEGFSCAVFAAVEERQQKHHDEEHHVFQIAQRLIDLLRHRQLWRGDLVEQLLDQAEQAEPGADEAAYEEADDGKVADHIRPYASVSVVEYGLHRSDRTRSQSSRAGVAVHSGNADLLELALIDRRIARKESFDVRVGKDPPACLDGLAQPGRLFCLQLLFVLFRLIQGLYTPCIY